MENLRVYLLGTFRLYRDGVLLTSKDWQIRHAQQLFKLLFTERGRTVATDKVIDLLWPYSTEHAHKTLRGAISILRTVLEPTREPQAPSRFVPRGSTGYTLQLPDDNSVQVDTLEFERLLDAASEGPENPGRHKLLASALQLYTGDYLAEDEQESWTFVERTRLRERYFTAALSLMEMQRKQNSYTEAIAVGRRALSFDTCREPLYPVIMYCQAALGDTVGALQTFEQCRQELYHRLGVYPAPQTLALHTELLQSNFHVEPVEHVSSKRASATSLNRDPTRLLSATQHTTSGKKGVQGSSFVGRKDIQQDLMHFIDNFREKQNLQQEARVIAIAGEVGTGKSFLLRSILNYARSRHVATMTTSCQQIEQEIVFSPLLSLIKTQLAELRDNELKMLPHPALAVLAHLIPELLLRMPDLVPTSLLNAEQTYSVFTTTFVDIFLALSQRHPLLVAIDDMQWIDEASLRVLHRLSLAVAKNNSLLLLLFHRPEDVQANAPLQTTMLSLGRCNVYAILSLKPFSNDEMREYLHLYNLKTTPPLEHWYDATQGNPLLLAETVRIYLDKDASDASAYNSDLIATMLQSQKIRDIFLARIARLPQKALELLELAAVIVCPFPPELLSSPLCLEDCKMLDILLARRFLLTVDKKEYEVCLAFSHEIIAKIVYTNCSALKRSQLHLQIAERMVGYYAENLDAHTVEIAFHYRHAGPQYQQRVRHYEMGTKTL